MLHCTLLGANMNSGSTCSLNVIYHFYLLCTVAFFMQHSLWNTYYAIKITQKALPIEQRKQLYSYYMCNFIKYFAYGQNYVIGIKYVDCMLHKTCKTND